MSQKNDHTTIIKAHSGWQILDWSELLHYKDLLYFMVMREVTVLYKQTILGFSWAVIRPVLSMIIFSIIFGGLAKMPSDGIPYPVFSYTALVPWLYFSTAMTKSTQSLIGGANIFTKVYFPRIIIPLTPVLAGLIDFFIALVVVGVLMAYYSIMPTINIIWLPLLILIMIMTSAGIGMWLSSLAIQYRDIRFAVQFLSQLLMYAAPVVWPASLIAEKYGQKIHLIYGLYPMAGVIEGFRSALLGQLEMPWDLIGMGFISGFILFISGALYFKRKERIFADVA
ncbi:MAG: ABC transporter permease [Candidatus Marinimicrobia bacterium]|nr:ABC transporter permease [Candidatus Neomarinimicrobiota bacterium]